MCIGPNVCVSLLIYMSIYISSIYTHTQFPDVVILDFFASIPGEADQKAWVKLIKDKLIDGEGTKKAPHLESQIKSLYTAITRCCDRLVFVETKETKAGKEFFRLILYIHTL